MDELETYKGLIDERHTELLYNGGFGEGEDPCDYIDYKEAVRND